MILAQLLKAMALDETILIMADDDVKAHQTRNAVKASQAGFKIKQKAIHIINDKFIAITLIENNLK